ncbi:hypothetical protein [Flavobacterium soyae]|nr:hypothetical protein [Flavobacterium soyae]MCD9576267.1 hypothetical protein [Flavobacterium soyae]
MKEKLFEHIFWRTVTGLIPLFLFAMIIFSDKQSGNDFLGSNFVQMILGFGSLILWSAWIIIEAIILFFKKRTPFVYANIILFVIVISIYILELYINHNY